jgi:polyphenol oxidase
MIQSLGDFSSGRVRAVYTDRSGGCSTGRYSQLNLGTHVSDDPIAVMQNRRILARHLPSQPLWLNQVHGVDVFEVLPESAGTSSPAGVPTADASFTAQANTVLAVLTADCLPVVLAGRNGEQVAVAHAGWRGLAGEGGFGILEACVHKMRLAQPKTQLEAHFGPAIGPRCFEVGQEVYDQFCRADSQMARAFVRHNEKWLADLVWLAQARLERLGVTVLDGPQLCTFEQENRFFSYRRDGITGRQATLVWIAG